MKIILKNSTMKFETVRKIVLLQPSATFSQKVLAYGRDQFSFILSTTGTISSINIYDLESLGVKVGDTLHVKCVYGTNLNTGAAFFTKVLNGSETPNEAKGLNLEGYNKYVGKEQDGLVGYSLLDSDIVVPEGAKCLVIGYRNTNPNVYFGTVHKVIKDGL